MLKVDLSKYNNAWYRPGSFFKRGLWYIINLLVFKNGLFPSSRLKVYILKLFGTQCGEGIVIRPNVTITYPWFLILGNNVWIGSDVCIYNLDKVVIGNNVCLSQKAIILTGSHNYKKRDFDLIIKPVTIEDGVWICTAAIVCPGITCHSHAILTAGSVANTSLDSYTVYSGNPAIKKRQRDIYS